MKCYVRIPSGSRVDFPHICPFTGAANPKGYITVANSRTALMLPMPFLSWFGLSKGSGLKFPAAKGKAAMAVLLDILFVFFLLAPLIYGMIAFKISPHANLFGPIVICGVLLAIMCRTLRQLWLRAVRIVRVAPGGIEVCFKDESYAQKFCELNYLGFRDRPFGL